MSREMVTEESTEQLDQLEEKILRAIELLQTARSEKEQLLKENSQLRKSLSEKEHQLRLAEEQARRLEKDRDVVRSRVEKVLGQVDELMRAATDVS